MFAFILFKFFISGVSIRGLLSQIIITIRFNCQYWEVSILNWPLSSGWFYEFP